MDITVWDKDAGKKDDFMGRYSGRHQSIWIYSIYQIYQSMPVGRLTGVVCKITRL